MSVESRNFLIGFAGRLASSSATSPNARLSPEDLAQLKALIAVLDDDQRRNDRGLQ